MSSPQGPACSRADLVGADLLRADLLRADLLRADLVRAGRASSAALLARH